MGCTYYERLTDSKVDELIHDLIKNQTLVKVATTDHAYEKLTVIICARGEGPDLRFQIDPPEGLISALAPDAPDWLEFEFADADCLPHRFEASRKDCLDGMWLKRPDHIRRYQLRNNFRIRPSGNAHAVAQVEGHELCMPVENISLGGVLCHCPNTLKPLLCEDKVLENLALSFSIAGNSLGVTVDRSVVKRIEGRTLPKHFGVALEFVGMKQDVQKRLTQIVYDLQRDFLKNRLRSI